MKPERTKEEILEELFDRWSFIESVPIRTIIGTAFYAGEKWQKSQSSPVEPSTEQSGGTEDQERLWRKAIDLVDTTCDYETVIERLSEKFVITRKP